MHMKEEQKNTGVITFPICEAGNIPLSNLVNILYPLSTNIYVITGNEGNILPKAFRKIQVCRIKHKKGTNTLSRVINYIYTQLRISFKLMKLVKRVNLWIFFIGGEGLLLPILTAKLFRKKVVLASAGSSLQTAKSTNDNLSKPIEILENICRSLSNRIVLYSENLIKEWNLKKYRNKISIAHRHFLEFDKFKMEKTLTKRDNLVGYIGRLSEEKGVLNFLRAISAIAKKRGNIKFLVGGDGELGDKIERYLEIGNLNDEVKLTGWIPHDELPHYLNELKLLVLPSYTEGLPNIALEAMACGTPVLATSVGAIPDIIKDGETGFIMENNSPECIVKNVTRVLNHPNLERIVQNARVLVEKEFTLEKAIERYRRIFSQI